MLPLRGESSLSSGSRLSWSQWMPNWTKSYLAVDGLVPGALRRDRPPGRTPGGTGRQAARPARARPGAAARSAVALIQCGAIRQRIGWPVSDALRVKRDMSASVQTGPRPQLSVGLSGRLVHAGPRTSRAVVSIRVSALGHLSPVSGTLFDGKPPGLGRCGSSLTSAPCGSDRVGRPPDLLLASAFA
jgi:hypothetical protein